MNLTLLSLHLTSLYAISPFYQIHMNHQRPCFQLFHSAFSHSTSSIIYTNTNNHNSIIKHNIFSKTLDTPLIFDQGDNVHCYMSQHCSQKNNAYKGCLINVSSIAPSYDNKNSFFEDKSCGDLIIAGCIFWETYAKNGNGGGIRVTQESSITLHESIFHECRTNEHAAGALICNQQHFPSDKASGDPTHTKCIRIDVQYCCFEHCYASSNGGYGSAISSSANTTVLFYASTVDCPKSPNTFHGAQFDLISTHLESKFVNCTSGLSTYCATLEYRDASSGYFRFQTLANCKSKFVTSFTSVTIDNLKIEYCNVYNNTLIESYGKEDPSLVYVRKKNLEIEYFYFIQNTFCNNGRFASRDADNSITMNYCFSDTSSNGLVPNYVELSNCMFSKDYKGTTYPVSQLLLGECIGGNTPGYIIITSIFTPSFEFSQTESFTSSKSFSASSIFENTDYFSKSMGFTESQSFTQSNNFSSSNTYTKSVAFSETSDFSQSSSFTKSETYTKSQMFSTSQLFTSSQVFTKSLSFTLSSHFSQSSRFSNSMEFSETNSFTKSSSFSASISFSSTDQFSDSWHFSSSIGFSNSNQFSKTCSFTQSTDFSDSSKFTKSFDFSPSQKFTNTNSFSASALFSDSESFSRSIEFSKSTLFSPSIDFSESTIFSQSTYFTDSNGFSGSNLFTPSGNFNATGTFTQSNIFSSSSGFSRSTSFTKSIYFTESIKFSESFDFSQSYLFSKSNSFIASSKFSKSNWFSSSQSFTQSISFTQSFLFSNSAEFDKTNPFSESISFTNSELFNPTKSFSNSESFSQSGAFSKSYYFMNTEPYTKSDIFTETQEFSTSNQFSQSDDFNPSIKFSNSFQFTNSNIFSKSKSFTNTEIFSISTGFTISESFSYSSSFTPYQNTEEPTIPPLIIDDDSNDMIINDTKKNAKLYGIAVGILVGVALLVVGTLFLIWKRNKREEVSMEMNADVVASVDTMQSLDNPLKDMQLDDDPFENDFNEQMPVYFI